MGTAEELPKRFGTWVAFRLLSDRSGQGDVYLAYDEQSAGLRPLSLPEPLVSGIAALSRPIDPPTPEERAKIVAGLVGLLAPDAVQFGALKVIKPPTDDRDPKHAFERFVNEVEALETSITQIYCGYWKPILTTNGW